MSDPIRQPETKHLYEFGEFCLDPQEKILRRGEKAVSLAPKVFDTLEVFVCHAGRLIEKDELMRRIWQDHFVEEGNLAFNVKVLRRALDDSASEPRFIETVPRRGYRFIAEVRKILEEKSKNPPIIKILPPPRKSRLPLASLIVLLLCTIAVASWLAGGKIFNSEAAPILSAPFHSEKFSNSGKLTHAVISPDGKVVAFSDETGGRFGIWLRRLETSENVQLVPPSDDFYFGLVFSHDGQNLYFVRSRQTETVSAAIYRVSIFGGIPEKIVEHAEGWISLSPDDRQISFVRCNYTDNDYCSLLTADTDGKIERKILTHPRPIRLTDNQFSPDGKSIAFASGESNNGASDFHLMKIALDGGAESEISSQSFFEIKNLKWLPDGESLLATTNDKLDGKLKIRQISSVTGEVRQINGDAANYDEISLDKNAEKMISTQFANNLQLYFSFGGATKILTSAREAVFAPDGKILYSTDDGDLWTINRDGSEQRQLTNDNFKDFMPYAAPDKRFFYFASNRTGANQVWRMKADGSDQIQITKAEGGYPVFASPDGQWIYYESGLHQTLWRVSADGSDIETEVSPQKLYRPAFSTDGKYAAFFFRDKNHFVKIDVIETANQKVVKTLDLPAAQQAAVQICWVNDNRTIDFVVSGDSKNTVLAQSLDENSPRIIAELGDREVDYFAVDPDDKAFVFTRGEWFHNAVLIDGLK